MSLEGGIRRDHRRTNVIESEVRAYALDGKLRLHGVEIVLAAFLDTTRSVLGLRDEGIG